MKRTVADMEGTLTYLMGVAYNMNKGKAQDFAAAYTYARSVLQGAEHPLRKLGIFEQTLKVIDDAERLMVEGRYDEADELLLKAARDMMERSGTNDRLRKLYSPETSRRKQ